MKSKTGQPASGYLTDNDNRIDNSWGHKSMSKKSDALKVGKDGYVPHPLDLSKVTLSENLQSKVEMIAKNVHEVWAAKRIAEGWSYGAVRNDEHNFILIYAVTKISPKVKRNMTAPLSRLH